MQVVLKSICLAIYVLAMLETLLAPGASLTTVLQYAALLLVAAHILEVLFVFRCLSRHSGPLVDSLALTLLFGVLHWLPLKRRQPEA